MRNIHVFRNVALQPKHPTNPFNYSFIQFHESSRIKIIIPYILSHAAFSKSWCRVQTAHVHTIFSSMSVIGVMTFWIMHQE